MALVNCSIKKKPAMSDVIFVFLTIIIKDLAVILPCRYFFLIVSLKFWAIPMVLNRLQLKSCCYYFPTNAPGVIFWFIWKFELCEPALRLLKMVDTNFPKISRCSIMVFFLSCGESKKCIYSSNYFMRNNTSERICYT